MSTPAAKRRRIDAASQALSKPFRSPFKPSSAAPQAAHTPPPKPYHPSHDEALTLEVDALPSEPFRQNQFAVTSVLRKTTMRPFSSPIATVASTADPEIAGLLRSQRELEKQLRELKEELDMAEQARKIEVDSERKNPGGAVDGELLELILKWRSASRQAAEELFTSVRDRVNRMGGPKAWREMESRRNEFRSGWDSEPHPEPDSDAEDGEDVGKRDLYAEYDIDPETANEKNAREGSDIVDDDGAEDVKRLANGPGYHPANVP